MITRTVPLTQVPRWQAELARAVTSAEELLRLLELDPAWLPGARAAGDRFALRVPRGYVARMRKGEPRDPLLRQILPVAEELVAVPGHGTDPVGDLDAMAAPGVLHKYRGRALLIATGACAVHCRYCFRRHFPYAETSPARDNWRAAMEHLRARTDVDEVILSGGDPLALSDRRLQNLVEHLESISHLRRLRIHTRLPIVLPERVDGGLLAWLTRCRLRMIIVLHANHAQELDGPVGEALRRLGGTGATLLNQAVLLREVNDDVEALTTLSEGLFDLGVLPYYLHMLDPVQGAGHFHVAEARAGALMGALREQLPGYLVPRLVQERPGATAKVPVPP